MIATRWITHVTRARVVDQVVAWYENKNIITLWERARDVEEIIKPNESIIFRNFDRHQCATSRWLWYFTVSQSCCCKNRQTAVKLISRLFKFLLFVGYVTIGNNISKIWFVAANNNSKNWKCIYIFCINISRWLNCGLEGGVSVRASEANICSCRGWNLKWDVNQQRCTHEGWEAFASALHSSRDSPAPGRQSAINSV